MFNGINLFKPAPIREVDNIAELGTLDEFIEKIKAYGFTKPYLVIIDNELRVFESHIEPLKPMKFPKLYPANIVQRPKPEGRQK